MDTPYICTVLLNYHGDNAPAKHRLGVGVRAVSLWLCLRFDQLSSAVPESQ